jgi:hypothetical protein
MQKYLTAGTIAYISLSTQKVVVNASRLNSEEKDGNSSDKQEHNIL